MRSRVSRPPLAWALSALALLGAAPVRAQDDGLSLRAAYSVQRDDNLFRLPDGMPAVVALGRPDGAETVHVRSLGLHYARDVSLQRIEADIGLVDYRYQTYSQLDLVARNHDLRWHWALTPHFTGTLRTERDESANRFEDASVLTQRNRRQQRTEALDARWALDGAWSVLGQWQDRRQINERPLVGEDSSRVRSGALGLRRATPKGSSLSLRWRHGSGQTLDADRPPAALRDDDFTQREWLLDAQWATSGHTRLDAGIARVQRRHARVALRDFDATNTRLALDWTPTAKLGLRLGLSRDTAGYQTDTASLSRTDRLQLGARWALSAQTRLEFDWSESRRRYGQPLPGQALDPRRDRSTDASLALHWDIARQASLELAWQHSRRHSTDPLARYRSTAVRAGVSARF